ncbi:hypothetical protein BJX63DRAFT_432313 [Aspergillus granulosus]|uniref:Uncharacterized protein n=1 Tax=Aspergillus granulosus TaxID=176169 RepID=A0ABR4HE57_9EURO
MSSTSLISVLLLSLLPHASAFQKSQCNTNIQALLANNTLSPTSPIFYRSLNGTPFSQTDNIILTVPGCESTCGTGTSFYDDVGPRLSTWLIPILLLLGNMHLARLGSEKYAGMLHVIGDPIDSMWSLLTTAESWSRSLEVAERMTPKQPWESSETYQRRLVDIATIYTSISELASSSDRNDPPYFARIFSSILGSRKPSMSTEAFYHLVKETANELSDSRAAGLRRAGIAVFAYFYQVIAGFVDVIGGESSSPPGGRIGTSMFISWLIPTVLVSNALGGFSSRRTALRILERFVKTVQGEEVEDVGVFSADKSSSMLSACGSRSRGGRGRKGSGSKMISTTTDFYASQRWSGSIYCYRAQKLLFRGGKRDTNPLTLFILSLLPVVISTSTSIALIWVTPTVGFDCRSLMMLVISLLWLLSALFTFLTCNDRYTGTEYDRPVVLRDL